METLTTQVIDYDDNLRKLEKSKKIKAEVARLKRILKDLDKNKLDLVLPLIKRAASLSVYLEELEEIINNEGYVQEYQNGANQKGITQSAEVQTYAVFLKTYHTIIKQLCDLAPPAVRKASLLMNMQKRNAEKNAN